MHREEKMVCVIWQFVAHADKTAEFERAYSKSGPWVELFRRVPGYRSTMLLKDAENSRRYITVDCWKNLASFVAVRERFATEYEELDRNCEELVEDERRIGIFEGVE